MKQLFAGLGSLTLSILLTILGLNIIDGSTFTVKTKIAFAFLFGIIVPLIYHISDKLFGFKRWQSEKK